jgi:hypothetical protein
MTRKQFMTIMFILFLCGCSCQEQKCIVHAVIPERGIVADVDLKVSKVSFMYWSKYQADVNTFGMTTHVYNAEGKPDAEAIKAVADGVIKALLSP